jgi:ribosome-associated toxin RatA of RatAB toxin-antitoxin module
MPLIEKSVLVPFSAAKMYTLVEKVEDYPQFLPWCGGASVKPISALAMEASIDIRFKGMAQRFTTVNTLVPDHRIDMALKEGPFSDLDGVWRFTALEDNACKVEFRLEYRFSSRLLEALVGPVFHYIASTFVDSFTKRAFALYDTQRL